MREYFTEAVVLDKEPLGEMDSRVFLYSDSLGRVIAKIRSARRITSKLNSHLEPLDLAKVRLIEKNNLQVADAVKFGRLPDTDLKVLRFINSTVFDNDQDGELWSLLKNGNISTAKILTVLGFDGSNAVCRNCMVKRPEFFNILDQEYYCSNCGGNGFGRGNFIKVY